MYGNPFSEMMEELEEKAQELSAHHVYAYLFLIYSNLGLNNKAFKVFETNSSILLLMFSDHLAGNIRTDDGWQEYHFRSYPIEEEKKEKKRINKRVLLRLSSKT